MTPGKARGLPDLLKWRAPKEAKKKYSSAPSGLESLNFFETPGFTGGHNSSIRYRGF